MKMFDLRLFVFVLLNLFLIAQSSIPSEILCANSVCTEPISKALGSVTYVSSSRKILSFKPGEDITIVSKSKNKDDYWGAVINGRSGFVPSKLIQEVRIFRKFEDLIPVTIDSLIEKSSTEIKNHVESKSSTPNENLKASDQNATLPLPSTEVKKEVTAADAKSTATLDVAGKPLAETSTNKIETPKDILPTEVYNVIDGTTVYEDGNDKITPSATVDTKMNSQTITPAPNVVKKESESPPLEQSAKIPLDVIKLNENYEGQSLFKKNNLTIVEEEDEEDEEDDDEITEEDENFVDDDEEEEEEDLMKKSESSTIEDPKKNIIKDDFPPNAAQANLSSSDVNSSPETLETTQKKSEPVDTLNSQPNNSVFEEIKKQTDSVDNVPLTNVDIIENTVTQEVNVHIESDSSSETKKNIENIQPDINELKKNLEALSQTEIPASNPTIVNAVFNNDHLKKPYLNPNIEAPSQELPKNSEPVNNQNFIPTETGTPESISNQNFIPTETAAPESISNQNFIPTKTGTPESISNQNFIPTETAAPESISNQNFIPSETTAPESINILNKFPAYANNFVNTPETKNIVNKNEELKMTDTESPLQQSLENDKTNTERLVPPKVTPIKEFSEKIESSAIPNLSERLNEELTNAIPYLNITSHATEKINEEVTASDENTQVFEKTTEEIKEQVPAANTVTPLPDVVNDQMPETTIAPDTVNQVVEEASEQTEAGLETSGFFSQMTAAFSGWFSANEESTDQKASSEIPENENSGKTDYVTGNNKDEKSDSCPNPQMDCSSHTSEEEPFFYSWFPSDISFNGIPTSSNTFLYLVVTAVTVLLFTLGHNFIEKKGKTGPLIAKINKLEQELLITSKECCLLKDEVQNAREKINLYENSANDELVLSLQAELEESKKARAELESSNEILQQELDAATEAGLDLNKMLSEVLTQKGGSQSLLESVENLQAQLNSQQKVIDEMTKKLGVKNKENETLRTALDLANEKVESLEGELSDLKGNLNKLLEEKEDLTQGLKSQINQLQIRTNQLSESKEKDLAKFKKNIEELKKRYSEASKGLAVKEEELKVLKESIKSLKAKGNINLESVFDVSHCKAELVVSEKNNESLRASLKEEQDVKKKLEDQIKFLDLEIQNLKKDYDEAEIKKTEAEKKLDVLSTYFKEKETQLQKELGLQEALWAQKKGDEKTVYNMMKSLQEEVESYKSQNETLKKEILDQERGLKNQIATLEQKAHENWVAARQAERKLEENKQETAQLRNRLTLIEKNSSNAEGKANHRTTEELNGEPTSPVLHDASSPLLFPPLPLDPNSSSLLPPGFMPHPMFMPPPVAGFIPPPPFLPGDRRPPPLGRMSSPPLNSRFSPSSPADYPFERMASPPLSPPARNYRSPNEGDRDHFRHRSPPYPPLHHRNWEDSNEMPGFIPISSQRDSVREPKGSNLSSGQSSSDSLEKSSRHSGRV